MTKYFYTEGSITPKTKHLHVDNVMIVNFFVNKVNTCCENPEMISVIYSYLTKETKPFTEIDKMPIHSRILSNIINKVLSYDAKYEDRDKYLIPILLDIRNEIKNNYQEKDILIEMLFNLDLSEFFGERSGQHLKKEIQASLVKL